MNQDAEQLRLLSIYHYVVGGIAALFACFPLIHVTMGLLMLFAPNSLQHNTPVPTNIEFVGAIFALVGGVMCITGWAFAICVIQAGRFLKAHSHHTFCLVMAGVMCIFVPFGTALGVFTLIVLTRPSVREMFNDSCPAKVVAADDPSP